jgi:hypothetical protein
LQEVIQRKAKLMSAFAKGELSAETVFRSSNNSKYMRDDCAKSRPQGSGSITLKIHKADLAYDELDIDQKRAVIGTIIRYVVVSPDTKRGGEVSTLTA